jgi:DNA-binding IscR family transcriptional regulator
MLRYNSMLWKSIPALDRSEASLYPMNSRFSTAVHILTLLASTPGERLTSELIASSVGTNPVVIRRQLAALREAKLVESKGARGGGWVLARKPQAIKLSHVRIALGEEATFRMHRNDPAPKCVVGQNVRTALGAVYEDAEKAVTQSLHTRTIRDLLVEVDRIGAEGISQR